jgi:aminoglycoside 6'-N-acetyltransferase
MNSLQFRRLCKKDLELLYTWFNEPTINQMYARNQTWSLDDIQKKYLPRIVGEENVPSFIIFNNDNPIGFIQYYCVTEALPEGIGGHNNSLFKEYTPSDLAGIDLFIAQEMNRGKGLGANIMKNFISEHLTQFKAIVVDPNSNNIHAIRCYEKAGFVKSTFSQDPDYIVMIRALTPCS